MLVEKAIRDFKMLLDTEDVGMSTQLRDGMNWEGKAPDILNKILQPDWTVIEMGACIGFYMCVEAKKAKHIYAIEADPWNCQIMEKTKKLNHFNNVEIFNMAIAPENTTFKFHQSPGRSDRGRLSQNGNIEVAGTKLDTFVKRNHIGRVDLIRCDIEGAEIHMVSGGIETLKAMPNGSWMFIDLHPLKFPNGTQPLATAIDKILQLGFAPKQILGPKVMGDPSFSERICKNKGFPKVFLRKE